MKPDEPKTKVESESYYVIVLEDRHSEWDWKAKKYGPTTIRHCVFKADRYQAYGSRLRVKWHPSDGHHWKTADGAAKALKKLVEKRTIDTTRDKPRVCRYTKTITHHETLETVTADQPQAEQPR